MTRLCMLFALAGSGVVGGCQSKGYQGRSREQLATYSGRELRSELSPDVAVPTVAAAGEAALRARGYSIDEKSVTHDHARLVARSARDQGWLEQTSFESYVTPNGTGIMVRVEPWGDEAASRAILDDVLARLGR